VEQAFGREVLRERSQNRINYTLKRIGNTLPNGIDGQIHLGHWIDFYCDDTVSLWRQLAFSHGKELVAPFATAAAARTALSIAANKRYFSNGRVKYLLKDLLHRRLPEYDVDKPKGHSGLPTERFAVERIFDRAREIFSPPDYLGPIISVVREVTDPVAETRWNLLTLCAWHHRVFTNAKLTPHPRSRCFVFH